MRRLFAAAAAAVLLTGVGLAVTHDAEALPPLGTTTAETVGGFSFSFTYNGPEWVVINDTSSAGATYKRPDVSSLVMAQSGANASLAASECNMANAIEAMQAKYALAPLGYFIGHSSYAGIVEKAIRHSPTSDIACSDRLTALFKGVGLSGVAWRVDVGEPIYPSGGRPLPPLVWPANITHVWWFTGVQHTPVNEHRMGGSDENTAGVQTWSMTITEAWHYTASMWDDPVNLPTPIIPTTITSPVIFDHVGTNVAGVPNHQRVVVTPNEGHVLASTQIDSDADYWSTMLNPADLPSTTTTSMTTAAISTSTTEPSMTTAPATTTSTATTMPTTTASSTTTVPPTSTTTAPDPVRDALVASVVAAQHALDVYGQAHGGG